MRIASWRVQPVRTIGRITQFQRRQIARPISHWPEKISKIVNGLTSVASLIRIIADIQVNGPKHMRPHLPKIFFQMEN